MDTPVLAEQQNLHAPTLDLPGAMDGRIERESQKTQLTSRHDNDKDDDCSIVYKSQLLTMFLIWEVLKFKKKSFSLNIYIQIWNY